MNKEFIPYEEALALKELGFDEQCFSFYDSDGELYESEGYYRQEYNVFGEEVIAPLYQQAFRWFREKHNIHPYIESILNGQYDYVIVSEIFSEEQDYYDGPFNSYEEAELICLRRLIELVINER